MYHGRRHRDGNHLRRRVAAEERIHGRADGRGQAAADGRIAVHDRVPEPQRRRSGRSRLARRIPARSSRFICRDSAASSSRRRTRSSRRPKASVSASRSRSKLGVGLFGGEGFIMQRLQGDGWAFVHAGGTLTERTLAPGETLRVDTGCIVAFQPSVELRHPVRRQDQVGALRRRGSLLRHAARSRHGLAAVAAPQPAGQPHRLRGAWRRARRA